MYVYVYSCIQITEWIYIYIHGKHIDMGNILY